MRLPSSSRRFGPPPCQRGGSLVSTLVATLALALGALAATRVQSQLRSGAETARQRAEAVALAQEEIERLRAFTRLDAGADGDGRDALSSGARDVRPAGGATVYRVVRTVTDAVAGDRSTLQVEVSWRESGGAPRRVHLETLLGRVDPALGAALGQTARGFPLARVDGRDARIPRSARDLGDGRSLLASGRAGPHAVVLDNATAAVVGVCRAGDATRRADPAGADTCTPVTGGLLVTGRVRFSLGTAPSALVADDAPLDFGVSLVAASPTAAPPGCGTEARSAGGERWVDYACHVVPAAGTTGWSGRVELVPAGWEIGTAAGRFRVCRHSADHDASGAIDRAAEHPARQRHVVASLAEQNFLVVAGVHGCPTGAPVEIDGLGTENHADLSTVPHQP